nr:hypothetical protein [Candidatus Sigynarchaeota archaeon]
MNTNAQTSSASPENAGSGREGLNKRNFYKSFNVSMAITAICLAGIVGAITIDNFFRPIISTSNYHFNLQYRAGMEGPMNGVVNNSLVPILQMYDAHPTWKANIEFQGQVLEWMEHMDQSAANGTYKLHDNITSTLELLQRVVNRGQVQLILMQYSDALAVAYPYLPWYKSINYTQELLLKYNITRVSRAIMLQEGQFFFGLSRAMQDITFANGTPIYDTIMGLREILSYFRVRTQAPLYTWTVHTTRNTTLPRTTTTFKVFPYWIIPFVETGAYYWNVWCQDGENVNTGFLVTWENTDFAYSDIKMRNHEAQIAEMEQRGNIFMTCSEWMARAEAMNLVQPLDSYIPETHWQVFNYRSQFIWMGENGDIDDGQITAMLYRTYQILQAVELMLNYSYFKLNNITKAEYEAQYQILARAWHRLADGMVTDVTGLSPGYAESHHAYVQAGYALGNATLVKNFVLNRTASLNSTVNGTTGTNGFQVVPYNFVPLVQWDRSNQSLYDWTSTIITDDEQFINITRTGAASEADLPFDDIIQMNTWNYDISRYTFESAYNPELSNLTEFYAVTLNFKWRNESTEEPEWGYIKFVGNFSTISYSPTMYENETISLNRADYYVDEADWYGDWAGENFPNNFEFFLPLSNGLLYSENSRFAIVKNCTSDHITGKWNTDNFRFMQTNTKNHSLPLQMFVLKDVSRNQALAFANMVNTWTPVKIAGGALE